MRRALISKFCLTFSFLIQSIPLYSFKKFNLKQCLDGLFHSLTEDVTVATKQSEESARSKTQCPWVSHKSTPRQRQNDCSPIGRN